MKFPFRRVLRTLRDSLPQRLAWTAAAMVLALVIGGPAAKAVTIDVDHAPIEVYFSPDDRTTEAIVREIDRSRTEILVQAYSFTSAPIAKALLNAHKRGVRVQAILDKSQKTEKYSTVSFLTRSGIPTYIDAKHAIAHNKIIIIDEATVITGSFNFTKNAEGNNAENLLVIRNQPTLVEKYLANFQDHKGHSEPYEGLEAAKPKGKGSSERGKSKAKGW